MRIIMIIILSIYVHISFSQTVKELENELSYFKSVETWGNKKDIARKLLAIDSLNNKAINYLVEVYGRNNQQDSIVLLFDSLIKNNPNNPEIYLLRAKKRNAYFAGLTFTERIYFLKKAIEIDIENIDATYLLGKIYYELFNKEYNADKKKAKLDYYSKNATIYFSSLISIDKNYLEKVKYPLIQLASYNCNDEKIKELENKNIQSSYFPLIAFAGLPDNWKTDYSINVLTLISDFSVTGIESAIFKINWYSNHLQALEEHVLSDSLPTKIYRFTYLRTFHNPIVIKIENSNGNISIHWKVSDGAGGYEPGKIIENKSKKLTTKDWELIENKINSVEFWSLSTVEKEGLGADGSQWILEGKTLGKYHVVDRWCGGKISSVCMELIELTDLKLKEDDVY